MNYLKSIKNKWQTVILVVLITVILALVLSLIQPFEYKSKVDVLVIQKQNVSLDAYAAARASEKLASNLASVIKTKSFLNKVVYGNFGVNSASFPNDENKLRKYWTRKVETQVFPETSILSVSVYDKDKLQANKIASAIGYILVNNSQDYHGGGSDVLIKVVNEPLVTDSPARPKLLLNLLGGLIVGLVLSLAWIFYRINAEQEKIANHEEEEYWKKKIEEMKKSNK